MKFKFIMSTFITTTILTALAVVYQFTNLVDFTTGFFLIEKEKFSIFFSLMLCAFIILVGLFSLLVRRCPLKHPDVDMKLSFMSFVFAIFMIFKSVDGITLIINEESTEILPIVINFICAFFFIIYGLNGFLVISFSNYLSVIPLVYWIVNLVYNYIQISKMQLIAENAYLILANASTALFSLYFAKLCFKIKSANLHKYILSTGIIATEFSVIFAVSHILSAVRTDMPLHNDLLTSFIYLINAIFIITFLFRYFSNGNLSHHHRNSGSKNILPH